MCIIYKSLTYDSNHHYCPLPVQHPPPSYTRDMNHYHFIFGAGFHADITACLRTDLPRPSACLPLRAPMRYPPLIILARKRPWSLPLLSHSSDRPLDVLGTALRSLNFRSLSLLRIGIYVHHFISFIVGHSDRSHAKDDRRDLFLSWVELVREVWRYDSLGCRGCQVSQ